MSFVTKLCQHFCDGVLREIYQLYCKFIRFPPFCTQTVSIPKGGSAEYTSCNVYCPDKAVWYHVVLTEQVCMAMQVTSFKLGVYYGSNMKTPSLQYESDICLY